MTEPLKDEHEFTSSWRWTESFESWVESLIPDDAFTVNVCAGLSPVGDVRVDVMTPAEIIELMQDDENTDLDEARDVLDDLLTDEYVGRDVIQELYTADDPASHPLSEHIDAGEMVFSNVFDADGLPFETNAFEWTVCDPPWKELSENARDRLFTELVRITEPDGHIIFNAWWVPSHEQTTMDAVRFRMDSDRYPMGTPSVSYAAVYTVHSSDRAAKYLSRTFTAREYTPSPSSLREAIESEIAYRIEAVEGRNADTYDIKAVGPREDYRCPHCGCTNLMKATPGAGFNPGPDDDLYQCRSCEYPVPMYELEEIADGHIQRIRHEAGFSTLSESDIRGISATNPPAHIIRELVQEPGIDDAHSAIDYLRFALPLGESPRETMNLEPVLERADTTAATGASKQATLND